jgi:tetratricopeptide (TPR) repeat protein
VADYLALFHTQRAPLLGHRGEGARDHPASVATTLQLAISTAVHQHPALFDLLRVCAFLHADGIPEELFRQAGEHLGTELSAVTGLDLTWNQLMAFACGYSLLSRQPEQRTLWLHRLVQAVVLDAMTEAEREQWTRRIIRAFQAIFPAATPETWGQCERLVPHLLTVADATSDQVADQALAEVLQKAATYLRTRAHYRQAELLYIRALHIQEQLVGVEHPLVVPLLNRLASVSMEQGNYEQAKGRYERALKIGEQTLGPEHKEVAYALNNLATHCLGLGNYEQAEPLYERALLILERALGPDHHLVAHPLNGLASVYTQQGKYEQAEPLYERALLILERALGPDHHLVAHPLNGLASVYTQQGKYEQAQTLCERALRIKEEALGPEHPHVAQVLDSLAQLCVRQGKGEQAERLYQRAIHILEQRLGPKHPDLVYPLHGLASFYLEQNRYREAESLYWLLSTSVLKNEKRTAFSIVLFYYFLKVYACSGSEECLFAKLAAFLTLSHRESCL